MQAVSSVPWRQGSEDETTDIHVFVFELVTKNITQFRLTARNFIIVNNYIVV